MKKIPVSIKDLGLLYLLHKAIVSKAETDKVARWLRAVPEDGAFLSQENCRLLADLLECKRRKGRPQVRKDGAPDLDPISIMHRFAWNCANIGTGGGPANRSDAKAETCRAFGICENYFEELHRKHGHYAADIETRYRTIDAELRKELTKDDFPI